MWYSLPTDRLRTQIHAEYKNTNYAVVNPLTIENVSFYIIPDEAMGIIINSTYLSHSSLS